MTTPDRPIVNKNCETPRMGGTLWGVKGQWVTPRRRERQPTGDADS